MYRLSTKLYGGKEVNRTVTIREVPTASGGEKKDVVNSPAFDELLFSDFGGFCLIDRLHLDEDCVINYFYTFTLFRVNAQKNGKSKIYSITQGRLRKRIENLLFSF